MNLDTLKTVLWAIAGLLTLCNERVSKFSYGLCWGFLMLQLITKAIAE